MDITDFDFNLIREFALNAGIALALLAIIYLVLYAIDHFTRRLKILILKLDLKNVRLFGIEVINTGKQTMIITTLVNALQILLSVAFLYLALVVILSEIPATESIAVTLVDFIFNPLGILLQDFVDYLPSLFNIVITILVARYLIKSVKYISQGVVAGNFHFPGFHPRTARTTASIITSLVYILTIILIFPSMPGYGSGAFNGIAAFLGALITIGGSSVIANYMAGLVLTYMHAFEKGDWVTIGDVTGKVVDSTAFSVRIESYKKEAINIPNSKILGAAIRNHSSNEEKQMILHTEVSIGYDVPWKKVNELLLDAAARTDLLDREKEPFVLQQKLDDFYIVYELNVFLSQPELKPRAHSSLHAHILDVFNEASIEIMSPHYRAHRDGEATTISHVNEPAND